MLVTSNAYSFASQTSQETVSFTSRNRGLLEELKV
jgi:hypothetical protein